MIEWTRYAKERRFQISDLTTRACETFFLLATAALTFDTTCERNARTP